MYFYHYLVTKSTRPELRFLNSSTAFDSKYYEQLEELGILGQNNFVDLSKTLPEVVIVTAVSDNHAGEMKAMAMRLSKDHPKWKVYVYDIGLTPKTREWFEVGDRKIERQSFSESLQPRGS